MKYNYNLAIPLRRNKPVFCTAQALLNRSLLNCFPSLQSHPVRREGGGSRIMTWFFPIRHVWEAAPTGIQGEGGLVVHL